MKKGFLLLVLGAVLVGLSLGALLASLTAPSASSNPAAALSKTGGPAGQGSVRAGGDGSAAPSQGDTTWRGAAAQGQASRPLQGSVISREGDTLTLDTQQGQVKVGIAGAKVQKTVEGAPEDLKPGQRVAVAGQRAADGNYIASTIQIVPESERPGRAQREATPAPTEPTR